MQNRFSILAGTQSVNHENYHILEKACSEIGSKLLPKSKPKKWKNLPSNPLIVQARKTLHHVARSGNRQQIKQAKNNLKAAYKTVESNIILEKTKQLEEKYYHNQHSEAWKIIKDLTGTTTFSHKAIIGTPANQLKNWHKTFSELLGTPPAPTHPNSDPIEKVVPHTLPIDTTSFREEELDKALNNTKHKTQVGPDLIPLEVWAQRPFKLQLLNLCNAALNRNEKPSTWSQSHIIPIFKKGDRGDPANYRGISLNTIASKHYNRMLLYRIQPFVDKFISWTQAGFRKSRSTLSNILVLWRIIEGVRNKNISLAMVFVDFRKAFDSIDRNKLFLILEAYGIPKKIINAIKIIYENSSASVISPVGMTDFFKVLSGIFQGDTLSPFLFIIIIDYVLRQAFKITTDEHGIQITNRRSIRHPSKIIKDLAYADDVALLAHTLRLAEELLHNLENAAKQVGLKINEDKTKTVTINITDTYQIKTNDGAKIKTVPQFTYLGSEIPNSDLDFKRRKGKAWDAMNKLTKVWKSTIPRSLKLRFFHATVESILVYASETWTITSDLQSKIDGCYTKMLRRVLNMRWQDHPTNENLYQDLPKLSQKIKLRRLKFAGHCARASDQPISNLLFWTPQSGPSRRGRPYKTYANNLHEDTNLTDSNEITTLMMDKAIWKEYCKELCNIPIRNPPTGDR